MQNNINKFTPLKIGFVPTYRYDRNKAWCERVSKKILEVLKRLENTTVLSPTPNKIANRAIHNLDDAELLIEDYSSKKVDCLVVCPLDFGDERSVCKTAEMLQLPLFLFALQEPPALEDASMARVSDSYCGTLSISSGLYRRNIPFHFGGIYRPDDDRLYQQLSVFIQAVSVVKGFLGVRLGQIGVRVPTFETVCYNEFSLINKFKQNIIYTTISEVVEKAGMLTDNDPRVQQIIQEIKGNVSEITVSDAHLIRSAKLELTIMDFWDSEKLSAMAIQCWPGFVKAMNIELCAVFSRLTNSGRLTACETDLIGALSMLAQYRASLGKFLPHFIDWTIQHRENENCFLAWHCGNAPICLAENPKKVALRARYNMTGELPVTDEKPAGLMQFQLKPGNVTICRLAENNGKWRMLITEGKIINSDDVLHGTWAWVEVKNHSHLYRTLVEEGFIHHASLIHGEQKDALLLACKFLKIEPVFVV